MENLNFIDLRKKRNLQTDNFLKVSEAPKTKNQLKKAILSGEILVFEKDNNHTKTYELININQLNSIINLWSGFNYSTKFQGETNEVCAYLGTSFYYKFKKS